ncbi:hypothetical protein [Novosphingobium olei]|uniref:hypothetical protein n=1 Tax=Novosphingobium olei TaxID=2728851 RepID=UPI0030865B40|nr:polysaccharide pyruvyl transferase family protein [Novosphingobium olei]
MTLRVTSVYRRDETNVGDAFCAPSRYFDITGPEQDILELDQQGLSGVVIVGGGGLIAQTFAPAMTALAECRPRLDALIGWGMGESLHVDRKGGMVMPFAGALPDYLGAYDLLGVRDFGTPYRWTPCASCMSPEFDRVRDQPTKPFVIYEHKRIPVPIDGQDRLTNDGNDISGVLDFLASGEVVITNSYHGAYWATLLGRRVVAIPNMSKLYRLKHAPAVGRAEHWRQLAEVAVAYPEALAECREANRAFMDDVTALCQQVGAADAS